MKLLVWVLTYMLSKPPRLELFNDITLSYMATKPPWLQTWCYHPARDLVLSPGSHITAITRFPYHCYQPVSISSLLSLSFISSTTTLDFFLYFLLARPFETFYLVSHSKLCMLSPRKWKAVDEPLSAVTWRDSTLISMSRDRMEAANESFTFSSRLAAITMK